MSPDAYRTAPEKIAEEVREERERRRGERASLLVFVYGGIAVVASGASLDVAFSVSTFHFALFALAGVDALFGVMLIAGGFVSLSAAAKEAEAEKATSEARAKLDAETAGKIAAFVERQKDGASFFALANQIRAGLWK